MLLAVRGLVSRAPPTDQPDPMQAAGLLLILGTLTACVAAGTVCWSLLSPLPAYRRGGLSMVTAFTVFVVALLLAPVNELLGPAGLGGVAVLAGLGAWALRRRALRLRGSA